MSLPKFVAFQTTYNSRDRYLGNIDTNNPTSKRFLAYMVDDVLSPFARFEIETVEDGVVQIRSCFTNRLWSRSSFNENWIITSSSEEVKDKSNWECTLFKPKIKGNTVTFTHVQLQRTLVLQKLDNETAIQYLCVDSDVSSSEAVSSTFIDLTSLVKLPKYITFKDDNTFLDASIVEVLQHHDGSIRFKCVKSDNLIDISPSIEDIVKMNVNEPVAKRTIEVIRLRIEDFIFLGRECYTLDSKRVERDQMVSLKSESLETMEWSKSVSLVTDLSFSIQSPTPYYDPNRHCFVSSNKIYKAEDYKWGTKKIFKFPVRQSIPIMVPAGETIVVRLMARSVRFQIPFDYTQTDTFTFDGSSRTYTNLRDGVYTGEFYSDFYVEAENEKL